MDSMGMGVHRFEIDTAHGWFHAVTLDPNLYNNLTLYQDALSSPKKVLWWASKLVKKSSIRSSQRIRNMVVPLGWGPLDNQHHIQYIHLSIVDIYWVYPPFNGLQHRGRLTSLDSPRYVVAVLPEAMVELGPQRWVRLSERKDQLERMLFFFGSFIFSIGKTSYHKFWHFWWVTKGGVTLDNTTLNCTKPSAIPAQTKKLRSILHSAPFHRMHIKN